MYYAVALLFYFNDGAGVLFVVSLEGLRNCVRRGIVSSNVDEVK
jgi:hypothetical protein